MKKGVTFLILVLSIVIVHFANAAVENETTKVNLGYTCLNDLISNKTCAKMTSEEKIFSLWGAGKCRSEVNSDAKDGECWPKSACDIKTTAQALIALKNSDKAENWLLSENRTPEDLEWYLQIESVVATDCEITFSSGKYSLSISEDKQITSSSGKCFSRAQDDYWLKISTSCLGEEFQISCQNDFLTNLIYKQKNKNVFYISPETSSAASGGQTTEKINSFCFGTDKCDYEGSLWAALALSSSGHQEELKEFLPYLLANAEDNKKYLPESFLYLLTGDTEYRSNLILKQNSQGYWVASSSTNKFYDTAVAMLSFSSEVDFAEKTKAKDWLFSTQGKNGCWENNIRNTAFILASTWPKSFGDGGGSSNPDCSGSGYFCRSGFACQNDNGVIKDDLYCSGVQKCCTVQEVAKTCSELNGTLCKDNQECDGGTLDQTASDASSTRECCIAGSCKEVSAPSASDCETFGGTCADQCGSGETSTNDACTDSFQQCCVASTAPAKSYLWVWILSIAIVIILLGILFRDKLRLLLLRFKGGKSRGQQMPPRSFPPPTMPTMIRRPMQRTILPPQQQVQRRPLPKPKEENKELDDVLKKLKDMGK